MGIKNRAEEIPTNRPVIAEQPKITAPAAMENDPFGRPTPSETEPPARTPTMVGSSPDGFESPVEVKVPTDAIDRMGQVCPPSSRGILFRGRLVAARRWGRHP